MGKVVLVTGVSRSPGTLLAEQLSADPAVERVVGVDLTPPPRLGTIDFFRADIRTPAIAKVLDESGADTVVHAATLPSAGARGAARELVVIGTMQLLAACQRLRRVRAVVVQSSTAVYGASSRDPAVYTEDLEARGQLAGRSRDLVEIEGYVRSFGRRRADVRLCVLRFAHLIGPSVHTAMARYLRMPVIPTPAGFDARLQFVHVEDAAAALRLAATGSAAGTYNVAGDGILFLSQAARRLGRPTLPVPPPLLPTTVALLGWRGAGDLASSGELAYGHVADTTRMRAEFGFTPKHSTLDALLATKAKPGDQDDF
jgi:UDP-glucose 4-epimerase